MAGDDFDARVFAMRLGRSRGDLFGMLERLYGERPDYPAFCAALTAALEAAWAARPADLKWQDLQRDLEPDWFLRPGMVGYVFYLDRFNGDLLGVLDKLDWLEALGVTYVHFMPCLKPRPGDSDGGYSVMDYRAINPAYGTMADFEAVATALRGRGISLCVDFVLNHTAKEHAWAERARKGERRYQDYYLMFDDDTLPKRYEETLVEVFPDNAPGSFTWYPELGKWVWTTFNEHQWDLNWANPWVFLEMVEVMLFLANKGVDVLRLDAVAFMWKRMGTRCQSEPEVHMLLHALRAASRMVAPSVIHLAEAIVGAAGDGALPGGGRAYRAGGQPRLPQLADGAVLVGAGDSGDAADDACPRRAFPGGVQQRDLRHLHPVPRRHRLGGDRRGRAGGRAERRSCTGASCRTSTRGFTRGRSRRGRSSSSTRRPGTSGSRGASPRSRGWSARRRRGMRWRWTGRWTGSCSGTR